MSDAIFRDSDVDLSFRAKRFAGKAVIYALLIAWAIVCLFPIYWILLTSLME